MAMRQKVRFTGTRTGNEAQLVPGIGLVRKGQQIELGEEEARAFAQLHPAAGGVLASDFELVGEPFDADADAIAEVQDRQASRGQQQLAEAQAEAGFVKRRAHEDNGSGLTASEEAELIQAQKEADAEAMAGVAVSGERQEGQARNRGDVVVRQTEGTAPPAAPEIPTPDTGDQVGG